MTFLNLTWSLLLVLGLAPVAEGASCNLSAAYQDERVSGRQDRVAMIVSLRSLGELNNQVFLGWGGGSELFANHLHFLLQGRLASYLRELPDVRFEDGESPFVKVLHLDFAVASEGLVGFAAVVDRSIIEVANDYASLMFQTDEASFETQLLAFKNRDWRYFFSESRDAFHSASKEEIRRLLEGVRRYFSSQQRLAEYVQANYRFGLGRVDVDADFAMRRAMLRANEGPPIFDLISLKVELVEAQLQREQLAWALEGLSRQQLVNLFQLLKLNFERKDPRQWDSSLHRFMKERGVEKTDLFPRFRQLIRYVRQLNLFDHLPTSAITVPVGVRSRFEALKDPTGLIFADFRGLATKNLALMHEKTPLFLDEILAIESVMTGQGDQRINKVHERLIRLTKEREEIFKETGQQVIAIENRLIEVLSRLGIGPSRHALWRSGDDIFLSFHHATLSAHQVAIHIKSDPELHHALRVGYHDLEPRRPMPLEQVRYVLGMIAHPLKTSERLFDFEVVAGSATKHGLDTVQMGRIDRGQPKMLPILEAHLSILRNILPEWDVKQFGVDIP